jgi:hypothetical protein
MIAGYQPNGLTSDLNTLNKESNLFNMSKLAFLMDYSILFHCVIVSNELIEA